MTVREFKKYYKEYTKNFHSNYRLLDLNFDTTMKMRGMSDKEYHKHMNILEKEDNKKKDCI